MTDADERDNLPDAVLQHLSEGIFVCGPDGRILKANTAARDLLGDDFQADDGISAQFLQKPFSIASLSVAIETALGGC